MLTATQSNSAYLISHIILFSEPIDLTSFKCYSDIVCSPQEALAMTQKVTVYRDKRKPPESRWGRFVGGDGLLLHPHQAHHAEAWKPGAPVTRKTLPILLFALLALTFLPINVHAQALNPYAPHNAVAAEPDTPYNLWGMPSCSRTEYLPCPTCGPQSAQLPDLPPIWQPVAGPFNFPASVP